MAQHDVRSLTDFHRNTRAHIKRLKKTGRPEVLTLDGRAQVIVQDAAAYRKLLEALDRAEAVAGIRHGLESARRGETVRADEVLDEIRQELGLPESVQ